LRLRVFTSPAIVLVLVLAGCSSVRPIPKTPTAEGVAQGAPAAPLPLSSAEPPSAPAPEPIYRNPKIGMVFLRAYQDAEGRLFGPQVMYQVTDPGSWNVEAVEQGKGYISAANIEVPPNVGSPYVVPEREVPPPPPDSPLLDPAVAAKTLITGLEHPEDKRSAESLAARSGDACVAVYDDQLGWLLVPRK